MGFMLSFVTSSHVSAQVGIVSRCLHDYYSKGFSIHFLFPLQSIKTTRTDIIGFILHHVTSSVFLLDGSRVKNCIEMVCLVLKKVLDTLFISFPVNKNHSNWRYGFYTAFRHIECFLLDLRREKNVSRWFTFSTQKGSRYTFHFLSSQ